MSYKKIALIGISASGKSTASKMIANKTGLPVFGMDDYFWNANGEDIPEEDYLISHEELLKNEEWIIEGYIDEKMSDRLRLADLILYLDYSGVRSALRLLQREAFKKFSPSFLWRVFTRGERPRIEAAIQEAKPSNLYRFSSPKDFEEFLSKKF